MVKIVIRNFNKDDYFKRNAWKRAFQINNRTVGKADSWKRKEDINSLTDQVEIAPANKLSRMGNKSRLRERKKEKTGSYTYNSRSY